MRSIKNYSDLMKIEKFEDRVRYLMTRNAVGMETYGHQRYLNQILYKTPEWRRVRRQIIIRDDGYDLGHPDRRIQGPIYVHHINSILPEDILERRSNVFDLENLISVSFDTHNLIHYGDETQIPKDYVERKENDTCPWKEVHKHEQKKKL